MWLCLVVVTVFPVLPARAQMLDGIAAIVGTNVITFSEVRDLVLPIERDLRRAFQGAELQEKLKAAALDALNTLVERQLIVQEFHAKEYKLPESVVDERLREIIRQDYGGNKNLLLKTITAQGMTMQQYRDRIRNQLIIQAMRQHQVTGEIIISPAKIEKYYEGHKEEYKIEDQVKLRMIVVKKVAADEENVPRRKLIEEIETKLKAGGDFAKLAAEYSEGAKDKEQQGDWGWITRDVLREDLAGVAFSLKPGEHSSIVETEDGYYLLKVEEFKPAHHKPLPEVRDAIEGKLVSAERQRLQQAWIDRLKAKAYIRYY